MDTLTHALSGALLARASHRPEQGLSLRARSWLGFFACAFPDSDFVLRWVDILFYFNWHRGATHSLILLPLWAAAGAWLLHRASRRRWPMDELFVVLALSLGLHVVGDLITAYGTRIWIPLSTARVGWNTTFIIDLIFTGTIVTGLLVSWFGPAARAAARVFLGLLLAYVGAQFWLHQQALHIAQAYAAALQRPLQRTVALPQPLSPLNWKLLVEEDGQYHVAYLRLWGTSRAPAWLSWLEPAARRYRNPDALEWQNISRYGASPAAAQLAQQVWREDAFATYRLFAGFPHLYRIDREFETVCVWFTDERFVLPGLTPPFRFGLCRDHDRAPWQLKRLPRDMGKEVPAT